MTDATKRLPYLNSVPDLDVDNGGQKHILIEGDNYDVLKALQYTHEGMVDVIYIDPPYLEERGKKIDVNYRTNWQRTDWLAMLDSVITLAHNLLKPTGVLMCAIDDTSHTPHLEIVIQNIFGDENKISNRPTQIKSGGSNGRNLLMSHEFTITYVKDKTVFKANKSVNTPKTKLIVDDKTGAKYERSSLLHNWGGIDRGDNAEFPLVAPDGTEFYHLREDGSAFQWRVPRSHSIDKQLSLQERMQWLSDNNEIHFEKLKSGSNKGAWQAYEKKWVGQEDLYNSVLSDVGVGTSKEVAAMAGGKDLFKFAKPRRLIKNLVHWAGPKDAVVLDFFAGSGTTLDGVTSLNVDDGGTRQCILVTNNIESEGSIFDNVTYPRCKAAITGDWFDGKGTPREASLVVYKCESIETEAHADLAIVEEMSDNFVGTASLKHGCYNISNFDDYSLLSSDSKTVLVWTNVHDDDDLVDVLADSNPDVAYLACDDLTIFGNKLDNFSCEFYSMPIKFVNTIINAQREVDAKLDKSV